MPHGHLDPVLAHGTLHGVIEYPSAVTVSPGVGGGQAPQPRRKRAAIEVGRRRCRPACRGLSLRGRHRDSCPPRNQSPVWRACRISAPPGRFRSTSARSRPTPLLDECPRPFDDARNELLPYSSNDDPAHRLPLALPRSASSRPSAWSRSRSAASLPTGPNGEVRALLHHGLAGASRSDVHRARAHAARGRPPGDHEAGVSARDATGAGLSPHAGRPRS